jgi:ankyrin repeat protein
MKMRFHFLVFYCLFPLTVWMGCRSYDAALMNAIRNQEVGNVQRLLESGAMADAVPPGEKLFPLEEAALHGNADIVKMLLEHGAVPDSFRGEISPLWLALEHDHEAAAVALVDAGAAFDNASVFRGMTPFYCAAMLNFKDLVSKMVAHGTDIHAPGPQGSPLHEACDNGNLALAKLLVLNGADVNRINGLGETPIFLAAQNGHWEIAGWLVQSGARPSATNNLGNTILHEAARHDDSASVRHICLLGVDPNVQNKVGETPLHLAAAKGHAATAIALIDICQADLNKTEIHGLSPAGLAFREGETEMVELLTGRGGRLR